MIIGQKVSKDRFKLFGRVGSRGQILRLKKGGGRALHTCTAAGARKRNKESSMTKMPRVLFFPIEKFQELNRSKCESETLGSGGINVLSDRTERTEDRDPSLRGQAFEKLHGLTREIGEGFGVFWFWLGVWGVLAF